MWHEQNKIGGISYEPREMNLNVDLKSAFGTNK